MDAGKNIKKGEQIFIRPALQINKFSKPLIPNAPISFDCGFIVSHEDSGIELLCSLEELHQYIDYHFGF